MSLSFASLLSTGQLQKSDLKNIFSLSDELKSKFNGPERGQVSLPAMTVVEAFFEPSTRTRLSFQIAANRLGWNTCVLEWMSSSSLVKEESEEDSLLNIDAMKPDLVILRTKGNKALMDTIKSIRTPVILAGWGAEEHPTQALLDVYTLLEVFKIPFTQDQPLKGKKILFVGDVRHSRVANSDRVLMSALGAELAICCPEVFKPSDSAGKVDPWKNIKWFGQLSEAAAWCDAVMGLRIQKERHDTDSQFSLEKYVEQFRLDAKNLKNLSPKAFIMHPGPFVPMVDFDPALLKDSRSLVHKQVENGVYTRAALMLGMLKGSR